MVCIFLFYKWRDEERRVRNFICLVYKFGEKDEKMSVLFLFSDFFFLVLVCVAFLCKFWDVIRGRIRVVLMESGGVLMMEGRGGICKGLKKMICGME